MENDRHLELLLIAYKNNLLPSSKVHTIFSAFTAADLLAIVEKNEYYFNLLALDVLTERHPNTLETQQALLHCLRNSRDNVREHALSILSQISNDFALPVLLERLSLEHSEALSGAIRKILTTSKNPNLNQTILQELATAPAYNSAKLLTVLHSRIGAEKLAELLQPRTDPPA